jgi:hypothetical protein
MSQIQTKDDPFGRYDFGLDGSFKAEIIVDRSLSLSNAFRGPTGCAGYLNKLVAAEILPCNDKVIVLKFSLINRRMTCEEYAADVTCHGSKIDPIAQAAYNIKYPDFSKVFPNGTQWKNKAGQFCRAVWGDWAGFPLFGVYQGNKPWSDHWLLCVVSE